MAGRSAVRRGRRARRVQVLGGRPYRLPPKCAQCDGYGLHAGVVIGARDRKGLERLCRYVARPPLANPRLEDRPDGGVRIRFKRRWSDGTEGIELSKVELVERLAALVHREDGGGHRAGGQQATGSPRNRPRPPGGCHGPGCCGAPSTSTDWMGMELSARLRAAPEARSFGEIGTIPDVVGEVGESEL